MTMGILTFTLSDQAQRQKYISTGQLLDLADLAKKIFA